MPGELNFFSYKIMPVAASSFTEFMNLESYYSQKELEKEAIQELQSRDIEVDGEHLSFTVKEGYLFAEGFGHTAKRGAEAKPEGNNSFHLLKRLIMLSNEILSEFQQKIFGKWRIEETDTIISIISKGRVIMERKGYEPMEIDYELTVGNKGYCWQAEGLQTDFEVVEETNSLLRVKIPSGKIITLVRWYGNDAL